jgi:hypothetical protein
MEDLAGTAESSRGNTTQLFLTTHDGMHRFDEKDCGLQAIRTIFKTAQQTDSRTRADVLEA